jgi:hypothetical protein
LYNQLGSLGTKLVEDVLVIIHGGSAVSRGGNDTSTSTRQQTLEDLNTDTALADTGEKCSFLSESDT